MSEFKEQGKDIVFALDIGTRSIVGVVGRLVDDRFNVLAIEAAEHEHRTMLDGQIDDINGVAALARRVTQRLEDSLEIKLTNVCVAAAGRALHTQHGMFTIEYDTLTQMSESGISRIEAGAVSAAEEALQENEEMRRQFYLVGYTIAQYRLDNYPLTTLLNHSGHKAEVDVVATFLPGEVIESLYAAMRAAGLQVSSMTLEPIAAMNAAIPAELRLLNLALVDIGAGTSDIAICRDGTVVGYTMVTLAGDEVTEEIMRRFLVDFKTAEQMKRGIEDSEEVSFINILGIEEQASREEIEQTIAAPSERIAEAIAKEILELNCGVPSAVFMAGGGSKLSGLRDRLSQCMGMDVKRVALAGSNFSKSAFSDTIDINNAEFTTPLGIAVSAGMGLLNDSYIVMLNGKPAKLFRNGSITLRDILLMNGYSYYDIVGRTGKSLSVTLDGKRTVFRGEPAVPAILRVNGTDAPITVTVHAGDSIDFVPARSGADAEKTLGDLLGANYVGKVLVNNEEKPLNTWLEYGDVILSFGKRADGKPGGGPQAESAVKPPVKGKPVNITLNGEPIHLEGKDSGEAYYLMDLLEYSGIDFKNLSRSVKIEINGESGAFQTVLNEHDNVVISEV